MYNGFLGNGLFVSTMASQCFGNCQSWRCLEHSAVIEGAIVGRNCDIRPHARIHDALDGLPDFREGAVLVEEMIDRDLVRSIEYCR